MKEFADRLKIIQRSRRMSQAQLAKTLGIAPGTLSGYMNDKNNPQITDVAKFAKILGVTIGWLCGEDKPNVADIFSNGNSSYGEVIEVTDKLIQSLYLGFHVNIEVKERHDTDGYSEDYEEVVFYTQNSVLLDYYKVYRTMTELIGNDGITPEMGYDLLHSKRMSLSDKKLNGEVECIEDDDTLPWKEM